MIAFLLSLQSSFPANHLHPSLALSAVLSQHSVLLASLSLPYSQNIQFDWCVSMLELSLLGRMQGRFFSHCCSESERNTSQSVCYMFTLKLCEWNKCTPMCAAEKEEEVMRVLFACGWFIWQMRSHQSFEESEKRMEQEKMDDGESEVGVKSVIKCIHCSLWLLIWTTPCRRVHCVTEWNEAASVHFMM